MAHDKFQPPIFQKIQRARGGGLGSFGTLPLEVRLIIYGFLYDGQDSSPSTLTYWSHNIPRADGLRKLLHLSKEFREEILTTLNWQKVIFDRTLTFAHTYRRKEMRSLLLDDGTADMIPNFRFFIDMDSGITDMLPDWTRPWDRREGFSEAVLAFNRLVSATFLQAARPGLNRGKVLIEFHNVHRGMCGFLLSSHLLKYFSYLKQFQEVRFRMSVRHCYRQGCCPPLIEDTSLAVAVMKQLGESLTPHFGGGQRRVTRNKRGDNKVRDHLLYIFWPQKHQERLRAKIERQSKSRNRGQRRG